MVVVMVVKIKIILTDQLPPYDHNKGSFQCWLKSKHISLKFHLLLPITKSQSLHTPPCTCLLQPAIILSKHNEYKCICINAWSWKSESHNAWDIIKLNSPFSFFILNAHNKPLLNESKDTSEINLKPYTLYPNSSLSM